MTCAKNSHGARFSITCALFAATLLSGACGGGDKQIENPDQRTRQVHDQISRLLGQIEDLEHGREVRPIPELELVRTDGDAPASAMVSPQSHVGAMSNKPAQPRAPRVMPKQASMCFARNQDKRGERCTEVCQLAGNICSNAGRICHLADQLGNDQWARDRCDGASESCTRANRRCCECN